MITACSWGETAANEVTRAAQTQRRPPTGKVAGRRDSHVSHVHHVRITEGQDPESDGALSFALALLTARASTDDELLIRATLERLLGPELELARSAGDIERRFANLAINSGLVSQAAMLAGYAFGRRAALEQGDAAMDEEPDMNRLLPILASYLMAPDSAVGFG
jgi:hypothetical protein